MLGVIVAVFVMWPGRAEPQSRAAPHGDGAKAAAQGRKPSSSSNPSFQSPARERLARPEPRKVDPNELHLRELFAAGETNEIHDQMQTLADAHQLATIGELLKTWCREGSKELVQWSLVLSSVSDHSLNLALNAEALSNPSEIMREFAAAELENASGIRFADTAHAKSWLATQPSR